MVLTSILTLMLAAAEPAAAGGPEPATEAEAKALVERLKQEIAQEEKAWAEETAREKQAEARRKQRHEEFAKDRKAMQDAIAGQEERMKESMAMLEALGLREKELQARFRSLGAAVAEESKLLRTHLDAEIPYRLDKRKESLALLVRDIEGGQVSPEEAANRLWSFLQNERRLAQEAEVYSGDLILDGAADPIQVKYLRLGKQVLAYSSLDGTRLGVLRRVSGGADSAGYAWVRETELDPAARKAVKEALATAEGISVPGFVPLPIWRSSLGEAAP